MRKRDNIHIESLAEVAVAIAIALLLCLVVSSLTSCRSHRTVTADIERMEKARAFDPFGHAGFDPSGKIRMTP